MRRAQLIVLTYDRMLLSKIYYMSNFFVVRFPGVMFADICPLFAKLATPFRSRFERFRLPLYEQSKHVFHTIVNILDMKQVMPRGSGHEVNTAPHLGP
jgi:hypothetical protein